MKYFGLRSLRTCGICRLRRGRSVTRMATRHKIDDLYINLKFANAPARRQLDKSRRKRVRDQLHRHGWNFAKRCRLPDHAKNILVPSTVLSPSPYGGLIRCDAMHVYFINYCTYTLELLSKLALQDKYSEINNSVKACHQFRSVRSYVIYFAHIFEIMTRMCDSRDPFSGSTHPRLPSVLHMKHLTAERRVRAIFYWAHVLGTDASVMPPNCRTEAQVAVASLQVLLIATRGHRCYTLDELNFIFEEIGTQFFKSLEALAEAANTIRMRTGHAAHNKQPDRCRVPVDFKKMKRHSDDSDTCSTDPEKTWGGIGTFEYSNKGLPHCLVHAAEQVMRGGHFGACDTKTVEAAHKDFIKAASKYSRTYASRNDTQDHMLFWVLRQTLWKEVIKLNSKLLTAVAPAVITDSSDDNDFQFKLVDPMRYTDNWFNNGLTPRERRDWGSTFLSKQVLVTRAELLTLIAIKLGINPLPRNINRLRRDLTLTSYGGLRVMKGSKYHQFVGISLKSSGRRDFVRLRGEEANTALSAQVRSITHSCIKPTYVCLNVIHMSVSGDYVHQDHRFPCPK